MPLARTASNRARPLAYEPRDGPSMPVRYSLAIGFELPQMTTPDELCAQLASSLHAMPFNRDEWVGKIEKIYQHLLRQSLASTALQDHPAYVAVHKALLQYWQLRYAEYGTPPSGFTLLKRAAKASKEATQVGRAFRVMDLVDPQFVASLRLLLKADLDGARARMLAEQ